MGPVSRSWARAGVAGAAVPDMVLTCRVVWESLEPGPASGCPLCPLCSCCGGTSASDLCSGGYQRDFLPSRYSSPLSSLVRGSSQRSTECLGWKVIYWGSPHVLRR